MTKELKALKELKTRYGAFFSINDDERCRIIETALKRIPTLEKALRLEIEISAQLNNERIKDLKKLKAFEIIKEKKVNVSWFIHCQMFRSPLMMYNELHDNRELTQEECDLLNEVLL